MGNGPIEKFQHGGNIYGNDAPKGGWLDFSANINPFGVPEYVKKAIISNIDFLEHYPEPDSMELCKAIGKHYGIPVSGIIPGNGATELLYIFFQCIKPKRVVIPVPSFSEYERAAAGAKIPVKYFHLSPADSFKIDFEKLKSILKSGDCVAIGNPDNPTGRLIPKDIMLDFINFAREKNILILIDESFMDFVAESEKYSILQEAVQDDHVFVIHSLTKFYAVPGLRLGFGAGLIKLIEKLKIGRDVWNVNSLAQKAGEAALSDRAYQEKTLNWILREKEEFYKKIKENQGLQPLHPTVNYMLIDISKTGMKAFEAVKKMRDRGILIRDCSNYPGLENLSYIRIAIRDEKSNDIVAKALREVFS